MSWKKTAAYNVAKAKRRQEVADISHAERAAMNYNRRYGMDPEAYPTQVRPPAGYYQRERQSRGETKYFDVGINASVTTAGTTWADTEVPCDNYVNSSGSPAPYTDSCLLPTAQGSGYGQINGNKYLLKTVRVKGSLFAAVVGNVTSVSNPIPVRLILVEDTMPSGNQAQGEEIFQDFGATEENAYAFLRMASGGGRFRILKDKIITLNPTVAANDAGAGTVSTGYSQPHFKFAVKPNKEVQVKTGNSTPTIGGTVNSNIFLLAYAYKTTSAAAITVQACSRAYYID